jgi:hypothetical protein
MANGNQRARIYRWAGPTKSTGACIVVEGKLALQGTIGPSTVLVQLDDRLTEDLIEGQSGSSAWGHTKGIFHDELRYMWF